MIYDGITTKPELDDYLEHHGIKGMRWGHRKQQLRAKGYTRRQANKIIKREKEIARGKKLVSKGRTTAKNTLRLNASNLVGLGASLGSMAFLNHRLKTLYNQGRWTPGHKKVAQLVQNVGDITILSLMAAHAFKTYKDNKSINAYYRTHDKSKVTKDNMSLYEAIQQRKKEKSRGR